MKSTIWKTFLLFVLLIFLFSFFRQTEAAFPSTIQLTQVTFRIIMKLLKNQWVSLKILTIDGAAVAVIKNVLLKGLFTFNTLRVSK